MRIKISQRAKLYKVTMYDGLAKSTYCLARTPERAIETVRLEYSYEIPRGAQLVATLLKPNNLSDPWKWYEDALSNDSYSHSLLLDTNLLMR